MYQLDFSYRLINLTIINTKAQGVIIFKGIHSKIRQKIITLCLLK